MQEQRQCRRARRIMRVGIPFVPYLLLSCITSGCGKTSQESSPAPNTQASATSIATALSFKKSTTMPDDLLGRWYMNDTCPATGSRVNCLHRLEILANELKFAWSHLDNESIKQFDTSTKILQGTIFAENTTVTLSLLEDVPLVDKTMLTSRPKGELMLAGELGHIGRRGFQGTYSRENTATVAKVKTPKEGAGAREDDGEPTGSLAWRALMNGVEIGDGRRHSDLLSWCEANLETKFKGLQPCNTFTTWFWCPTASGEMCTPPGNPLEARDREKHRKALRDAFLAAPKMIASYRSRGNAFLTADDYDMKQKTFRFYVNSGISFASLGGSGIPFTYTYKVKTIFGKRTRTGGGQIYEAAPITFLVEMGEAKAREFYALALPFGCKMGDCPTQNIVADLVYRLDGYREVGKDCVAGHCEPQFDHVFKLLGFRLRVADTISMESGKETSFKPGDVV